MSERPKVEIPADAAIAVVDDTLVVRHDGDVVLRQTLGAGSVRIEATGDVHLAGFRVRGAVRAGGRLVLEAPADVDELRAAEIEVGDVELIARTVVATRRIAVGRTTLQADVVSAPEVVLHPEATGRIRVLDCAHDVPATRVRGCLSVPEYEADFGDARAFLDSRGVTPVGGAPPEPAQVVPPTEPVVATPAPFAVPSAPESEEQVVDDPSDEPTVPPPTRAPTRAAKAIDRAVQRLEGAYVDAPPAAVTEAIALARRGQSDLLTLRLDALWTAVLREHLSRAEPVPHEALAAFHALRDVRSRSA
jgi:hypothetical protein